MIRNTNTKNRNQLILLAIPCLLSGGTEMQTLSLVKVLRSCGLAVVVVCYFEHDNTIVVEFQKVGVTVRLLDMDRNSGIYDFINKLRKEIYKINPDIVHVQYMSPGALPIIAARLAGVKTVFATVHQPYTTSHGRMSKRILKVASWMTTRFIAVSLNSEKSWFGSCHLLDENKPINPQPHHFTVYNAVDTKEIQEIKAVTNCEKLKKVLNIPKETPLIGCVSRLRHEKGIDLLIEALNLIIKEGIDIHLLVVGYGPDEDKLKKQAESLGISDRIFFYGAAEWEIAIGLMSIMDIVVVPSRFEGFGLTAAEAMAVGKPVIASDNFGLKEVVADKETGLTFKTEDIYDLTEKLRLLLIDTSLCHKYGVAGQVRAGKLFDVSVLYEKITALYKCYNH